MGDFTEEKKYFMTKCEKFYFRVSWEFFEKKFAFYFRLNPGIESIERERPCLVTKFGSKFRRLAFSIHEIFSFKHHRPPACSNDKETCVFPLRTD